MNHEYVLERLDDWVGSELPDDERQAVEFHLAVCAECRGEAEALKALLEEVSTLPLNVAPGRDLWAGVASRIEPQADVVPISSARRWRAPRWLTAAAAAVMLVVSSSVLTLKLSDRQFTSDNATGPLTVITSPTPTALVAFRPAEEDYERAISELQRVLATRRGTLSPETVRTLETNLRIIDEAIRQSRAALEKEPNSRELTDMLSDAYGQKLNVLQNAVEL